MIPYIKLACAACMPVIVSIILFAINKHTAFGKLNNKVKQLIYGVIFGALAIVGTEFGIAINGAQCNCRDAAVLIGGLMFGGPAGILAGFIGGVERWIAVAWGVGTYTRVACTLSTIVAGIYAALLRKYMFEDKKPTWTLSLAIGVVMEVFHLTMVFITHMESPIEAMAVVRSCSIPMILANSLSVMLSSMFISLVAREYVGINKTNVKISQTIQRWLLLSVCLAFLATSYFVYSLQTQMATTQSDSLLDIAIDECCNNILDESDENLLSLARKVKTQLQTEDVQSIAKQHDIAEINVINKKGIIVDSTQKDFIGFNMYTGVQSAHFTCLLRDTQEYVQSYGPIAYDESIYRKYAGIKTDTGFVQIGYDAVHFQKDIDETVVGICKNVHVGKTGYVLILDEKLKIISAPKNYSSSFNPQDIKTAEESTTFTKKIGKDICYCRVKMSEGYYIVSILPESEALQMRNIALYVNTFMEILVFAILFAMIYLLIKKVVVDRIKDVNGSLSKITGGDLNTTVNVRTNEEFAYLSDDINSTVDTLKKYIAEAASRIDKELEFAKEIQISSLPNVFPAFPKRQDFDIYASMNPAKEVGGDFYDFYITKNDTLNFLIADVSGKGIPAAMFMMRAKTELKSLTENDLPLNEAFTNSNRALCEGNDAGMFVTAWQGSIDLLSGKMTFANAGHNPPLIRHADGKFEYLKVPAGFVLAGMENMKYKSNELNLYPGDIIFLYTDGVTEATNASEELYGEERLLKAINSQDFHTMKELCEYIKTDVDAFVSDAPQFDDITMLALRYVGPSPENN